MSGKSLPEGGCPGEDNGMERAGVFIAGMKPGDVPEVAALERSIFSMPWSENGFLSALQQPNAQYLVVREACGSRGCAEMTAAEGQRGSDFRHAEAAFCESGKEKTPETSALETGADSQAEASSPEAGADSQAEVFAPEAGTDNPSGAVFRAQASQGRLLGYCGLLQSFDEADIVNVAVREDCRGQGIGFAMLSELMRQGRLRGIERFTLEVRKSNAAALHLYEKLGFFSVGIRRNFYSKPREDAVIMWTSAPETAEIR